MPIFDVFTQLAGAVTSISVIGAALIWIYKKLVVEPDSKMAQKLQTENNDLLRSTVEPLTHAIEELNRNLDIAAKERNDLRKNVEIHEGRLDAHDMRITVLETKGGATK